MLEVVFSTFSKHIAVIKVETIEVQQYKKLWQCFLAVVVLLLLGSIGLAHLLLCTSIQIIYKNAVKSLLASHGTSQRQSGCQESAVDRGCGRTLRPLLGLVVVNVEGQLYNCEETCTFAEVERELNLTLLVGTTSFAKIHSSSRL